MMGIATWPLRKCFWLSPFTSTSWAIKKYPLYVFKFPRSPESNTKHCCASTFSHASLLILHTPKHPLAEARESMCQRSLQTRCGSPLSATWTNSWCLCFRDFQVSYWRHCKTQKCISSWDHTVSSGCGVAGSTHSNFHLAFSWECVPG